MSVLPQPLPDAFRATEVVDRVRAKWRQQCEQEMRRSRRRLQAFTPEQQCIIGELLVGVVDAALLPVSRYVEAAGGHEPCEIDSLIALLLGPKPGETVHAGR